MDRRGPLLQEYAASQNSGYSGGAAASKASDSAMEKAAGKIGSSGASALPWMAMIQKKLESGPEGVAADVGAGVLTVAGAPVLGGIVGAAGQFHPSQRIAQADQKLGFSSKSRDASRRSMLEDWKNRQAQKDQEVEMVKNIRQFKQSERSKESADFLDFLRQQAG